MREDAAGPSPATGRHRPLRAGEWADRSVVVTGAGGGIGGGIVEALLAAGANVVCSDLPGEPMDACAERFAGEHAVHCVAADLTDGAQAEQLAHGALERFGSLQGWVNNAGTIELGPALDAPSEGFAAQLDTNVVGLLRCCQAAARAFARSGGGSIVNVASNAGKVGFPGMVGYNASKAAVISLTRSLAMEWSDRGVNVNAVCPGSVRTPMLRHVAEHVAEAEGREATEVLAGFVARQLGRAIEPVEVGRVIVFLLSDAARIIRGQAINVDAGDTPY